MPDVCLWRVYVPFEFFEFAPWRNNWGSLKQVASYRLQISILKGSLCEWMCVCVWGRLVLSTSGKHTNTHHLTVTHTHTHCYSWGIWVSNASYTFFNEIFFCKQKKWQKANAWLAAHGRGMLHLVSVFDGSLQRRINSVQQLAGRTRWYSPLRVDVFQLQLFYFFFIWDSFFIK